MVFFNVGKLDYRIYRYELCVNAALYIWSWAHATTVCVNLTTFKKKVVRHDCVEAPF